MYVLQWSVCHFLQCFFWSDFSDDVLAAISKPDFSCVMKNSSNLINWDFEIILLRFVFWRYHVLRFSFKDTNLSVVNREFSTLWFCSNLYLSWWFINSCFNLWYRKNPFSWPVTGSRACWTRIFVFWKVVMLYHVCYQYLIASFFLNG